MRHLHPPLVIVCTHLKWSATKLGNDQRAPVVALLHPSDLNITVQAIPLMEFESEERCTAAIFHRSGAAVVAAYHDGSMRLFDLDSVSIQWSAACYAAPIVGLAMDRTGSAVLGASRDGTLTVTSAATGEMQVQTRDLIAVVNGHPVEAFAASRGHSALCAVAWSLGFAVCACPWHESALRTLSRYTAPSSPMPMRVRCWIPLHSRTPVRSQHISNKIRLLQVTFTDDVCIAGRVRCSHLPPQAAVLCGVHLHAALRTDCRLRLSHIPHSAEHTTVADHLQSGSDVRQWLDCSRRRRGVPVLGGWWHRDMARACRPCACGA
jgi:hypothetical protein